MSLRRSDGAGRFKTEMSYSSSFKVEFVEVSLEEPGSSGKPQEVQFELVRSEDGGILPLSTSATDITTMNS
jgi:hypothetical protein